MLRMIMRRLKILLPYPEGFLSLASLLAQLFHPTDRISSTILHNCIAIEVEREVERERERWLKFIPHLTSNDNGRAFVYENITHKMWTLRFKMIIEEEAFWKQQALVNNINEKELCDRILGCVLPDRAELVCYWFIRFCWRWLNDNVFEFVQRNSSFWVSIVSVTSSRPDVKLKQRKLFH